VDLAIGPANTGSFEHHQQLKKMIMKYLFLSAITFLLLSRTLAQPVSIKRELKLVELSGNGYQRGLKHGEQLKKEIAGLMVLWKTDLEKNMHIPADTFIHRFLSNTNFTPAIKKYTPDVLEEVRGIAAGSGQTYDDIFAFQLTDEYWVYEDKMMNDPEHHHCSGIGVPAMHGNPAYVSQNMDLDSWMDGYQVILHIHANGNTPEQYILTCAGSVAFNGMNQYGIGVCVNTLMQLGSGTDGLPVSYMIRGLLEKKNGTDALNLLQNTRHASGQNYILGIADSVYDFEASADKVVRMHPDASGLVYHTNHPVANPDVKPWYQKYYQEFVAGKTQGYNSEIRFATLKSHAAQTPDKNDLFIKTTLRSKDDPNNVVCRPHLKDKSFFTFGSVILSLSTTRSMQVTAGPPDESEYRTFSFKK
jgi:isopenicillin-N N-acyltransferase-like protein